MNSQYTDILIENIIFTKHKLLYSIDIFLFSIPPISTKVNIFHATILQFELEKAMKICKPKLQNKTNNQPKYAKLKMT